MTHFFSQYQNEFQGFAIVFSVLFVVYALMRWGGHVIPDVLKEEE